MRAIGIILAGGNSNRLKELSAKRAVGAMPIAGSYRAIDFALSNMSNSHIQRVAVLTQYNAWSLNEHLSSSKWWDFGRKQGGLYVFTPSITSDNGFWYRGTADAIAQNIGFLKKSHEPYVVIASSNAVYKLDYNKVLEYHIEKNADITIVTTDLPDGKVSNYGVVTTNDDGRIVKFEEKPIESDGTLISTGVYVIRRRLLIQLMNSVWKRTDMISYLTLYREIRIIVRFTLIRQLIIGGIFLQLMDITIQTWISSNRKLEIISLEHIRMYIQR